MRESVSVVSLPLKARSPDSIWSRIQPNAQTSVRLSTSSPRAAAPDSDMDTVPNSAFLLTQRQLVSRKGGGFATPKSSTLTRPSAVILMLLGFEIAMNDAAFACEPRAPRRSAREMFNASFSRAGRAIGSSACRFVQQKLIAIDQLEHQSAYPSAFGNPVDGADVWMVEGREQPGFALEARPVVRVSHPVTGENLDGHRRGRASCHAPDTPRPCHRRRGALQSCKFRAACLVRARRGTVQRRRQGLPARGTRGAGGSRLLEESASVAESAASSDSTSACSARSGHRSSSVPVPLGPRPRERPRHRISP